MTAIVQRVKSASVTADGKPAGKCGNGLLVLLGVFSTDTETDADILARKVANLRIFEDDNCKMNLSIKDINGSSLVVSNFTICADVKKGNRPSFINAMEPVSADKLYNLFVEKLTENGVPSKTGVFGADMKINAELDGPITITLNSEMWRKA